MTRTWRDGLATLLVAAVVVPYVGYLVAGGMPFVQDPRGMAAVGLILGAAAALAVGQKGFTEAGRPAAWTGVGAAALGTAALIWAEEGLLSEVLLAAFIVAIVGTWAQVARAELAHRHTAAHP